MATKLDTVRPFLLPARDAVVVFLLAPACACIYYLTATRQDAGSALLASYALGMFATGAFVCADRSRWRMAARTRHFLCISGTRVVLRYEPKLQGTANAAEVLQQAENILCELEVLFASKRCFRNPSRLPPSLPCQRVQVYLFASSQAVGEFFGDMYTGGRALWQDHAIVIPFIGCRLDEMLRHELAHLFLCRFWNQWTPPLLTEGLPMWLQETYGGIAVDRVAARWIAAGKGSIRPLLDSATFLRGPDRCRTYALAGSFTGFLLRRFGWEQYLRFYNRMAAGKHFDARFSSTFGRGLEHVEMEWQQQVMQKCMRRPGHHI